MCGGRPPALAWRPESHALVGQIADQLLAGTPIGEKVDSILDSYKLQDAAKWPDCVRSVHKRADGSFKFGEDKYIAPCTAFFSDDERARMEDYARRNWDTFTYRPGHRDHEAYHFADLPSEDGSYAPTDIGASDHDVVHAIDAAIAELEHKPVPASFSSKDDKEAILLLAHFVGDVHQPLHVGAVYLDASGKEVDPKTEAEATADSTAGGNFIEVGSGELHCQWDAVPADLAKADVVALVRRAASMPADAGSLDGWAMIWASESVAAAAKAYSGITFAPDGLTNGRRASLIAKPISRPSSRNRTIGSSRPPPGWLRC